jgi:hypothetical protein
MKVAKPDSQGSFGIPQHVQEARQAHMDARAAREASSGPQAHAEEDAEEPASDDDMGFGVGPSETSASPESDTEPSENDPVLSKKPLELLKKMGVELTDEDFQKILFKGYVDKDVQVFPAIRGARGMTANLKTLTGEEYDKADELYGEELADIRGTNQGFELRQQMWILAFGVRKLGGKDIVRPVVNKNKSIDEKATAKERRMVLQKLSPAVLTKLMQLHSSMTVAINQVVGDPEANF